MFMNLPGSLHFADIMWFFNKEADRDQLGTGHSRFLKDRFIGICISKLSLLSLTDWKKKPDLVILSKTYSTIYAVNVWTHKKTAESKNSVNQGYLVVLKGRIIGYNYKRS